MKIISQFELFGKEIEVQQQDNGRYDVFVDGENKQPNHDADGVIRYLSNIAFNAGYMHDKVQQENAELKKTKKSLK